jgi:hypothetical protein
MLQKAPTLTPSQLKTDLKNTGVSRTDPANSVVTPRVDAYSATGLLTSVGGVAEAPNINDLYPTATGGTRSVNRAGEHLAFVFAVIAAAIALTIPIWWLRRRSNRWQ